MRRTMYRIREYIKVGTITLMLILACAQLAGAQTVHDVHTSAENGPHIACLDCHSWQDPSVFKDGKNLTETTICDICHSPNGVYDGVNDPVIGAKIVWFDNGVYNGGDFKPGKEKWCVGCHDNVPSLINGVNAPNVSGDNVNYGYFVTGHGSKGVKCSSCHNVLTHIDGVKRTYVATESNYTTYHPASPKYQQGYRLKNVSTGYNGTYPMHIPRTGHVFPPGFRQDWEFALCYECHNKIKLYNGGNRTTGEGAGTNFLKKVDGSGGGNPKPVAGQYYSLHDVHTWGANGPWGATTAQYDSDFNGVADSRMSCPACHNVHGSKSPTMIRTGELIGRSSALNIRYVNNTPGTSLIWISNNQLFNSTGAGLNVNYGPGKLGSNGVCNMCHPQQQGGPPPRRAYYRTPIVVDTTN